MLRLQTTPPRLFEGLATALVSVTKPICNFASMCNSRGVTNRTLFFIGGVGDREDTCMIITARMYACTIDKYKCDS